MFKKLFSSLSPCNTRFQRKMRRLFTVFGVLCVSYYVLIAFVAGLIRTSILYIWLFAAAACFAIAVWTPQIAAFVRRTKKWVLVLMAILPTLCFLFFCTVEIAILTGFSSDVPDDGDADYIIILGAKVNPDGPSLQLQRRIDAAYEYLQAHPNTVAIASGGQGLDEPMSEAVCIETELIKRGIDANRILIEDRSTDTAENIQFSRELIDDSPDTTVLIVSNEFHCFRAAAIARRHLESEVGHVSSRSVILLLPHYMVREFAGITVDWLQGNLSFE